MPAAPKTRLALSADAAAQALSPEQRRFNKLTQQIDQARDKLATWHSNLPAFFSAMREQSHPLVESLEHLHTTWIFEVEKLLGQKGWTKRERATRTALMQKANQAYDKKDLLTLLSLQLETAQMNNSDVAATAPARLKLYNKALAEQLADIQGQIKHIEYGLRLDFDLPSNMPLDPNKLVKVLDRQIKQLKQSKDNFELDLLAFENKQATKQWLRYEMERLASDSTANRILPC